MGPPVQKKNSVDANTGSPSPPSPRRKLSRSQSITTSSIPSNFVLPPEMEVQWKRRRESLEKLQLDKVAPWMHLHDFSDGETPTEEQLRMLRMRRQSLEKLQVDKVAPWMHMHDFTETETETQTTKPAN